MDPNFIFESTSSDLSQPISSPSTTNFSVFSSADSRLSTSTLSRGTSIDRKRPRDVHEVRVPQKRRKLMGRPKNVWTPSRRRKLVRLYLMTNLEVEQILKVIRTDGFTPCKRDAQKQLKDLLQPRPYQIRSKGHITQHRLRLLRECENAQLSRREGKTQSHEQNDRNRQIDGGNVSAVDIPDAPTNFNSEVLLSSLEHTHIKDSGLNVCLQGFQSHRSQLPNFSEKLEACLSIPSLDASQVRLGQPTSDQVSLEQNNLDESFDSHEKSLFPEVMWPSPLEIALYDEMDPPLLDFSSSMPGRSCLRVNVPVQESEARLLCDLPNLIDPSVIKASHLPTAEGLSPVATEQIRSQCHTDPLIVETGFMVPGEIEWEDARKPPSTRIRSARISVISMASLRKRLSQESNKHTSSALEDIIWVMEQLTISTSSAKSSLPTRSSKVASLLHLPILEEDIRLTNEIEYPIILPGAFPEFCWEKINNNKLRRCNKFPRHRKAGQICKYTGLGSYPYGISTNSIAQYKVYGPMGGRVDVFGNTDLHVAAALAKAPHFLIGLVRSGVNVHTLNNGGQTFLHLVHPESDGFFRNTRGTANDIRALLEELQKANFDFNQQDNNGRTSLHWLARHSIPRYVVNNISMTLRQLGIKLPSLRDNLGFTVTGQMKHFGMLNPAEEHGQDRSLRGTDSICEAQYIQNYQKNTTIETVEDLQRYEHHSDLLKTIRKGEKIPQFENWNGRNGLHCLAEVSFDLHQSHGSSPHIQPLDAESRSAAQRELSLINLLSSGVNPNSYDKDGTTPLMAFIIYTRTGEDEASTIRTLQELLAAGADVHRRNRKGETALHIAVKLGRRTATKWLLNQGANVHARTSNGLGILAVGYEHANKAKRQEFLYAQILLCITLVANAGAVSAPTILQEWGFVKEGYVLTNT